MSTSTFAPNDTRNLRRRTHISLRTTSLAICLLALASCETPTDLRSEPYEFQYPVSARHHARNTSPVPKAPTAETQQTMDEEGDRLLYKQGGDKARFWTPSNQSYASETLALNFVDAPIDQVVRAVIEQALGQTVSISQNVSGKITLTASEPVSTDEALRALETLLSERNYALVEQESGYSLTSLQDAQRGAQKITISGSNAAGYGITLVPLKHAKASQLSRLIDPIKSQRVNITFAEDQNILLLRGPRPDVLTAIEAIKLFDTDWMASRSVGLFEVRFANSSDLKDELDAVLEQTQSGASDDTFEIIALPRLNLLLVSAASEDSFSEAMRWLYQLDREMADSGATLHYYAAQNKDASELASALNAVFAETKGHSSSDGQSIAGKSEDISIVPDELNNGLIIKANRQQFRDVLNLLERMDIQSPQVLIEATIVEVRLTDDFRFGVSWNFSDNGNTITFSGQSSGAVAAQFPGLALTRIGSNVQAALSALESFTDVNVVSAPKLMVINNQTASLQVGDEVPIVTQQSQSVTSPNAPIVTNVQLRDTGVILEVKPRIGASGMVELEVSQEVSDVSPTTTSGIDSPTIQQRRFSSTVAVKDGNTIALGGLIRNSMTKTKSGVPVLQHIPLLGSAFKTDDETARRTELIVFLTPRVVSTVEDANNTLDYLRSQMSHLRVKRMTIEPKPDQPSNDLSPQE